MSEYKYACPVCGQHIKCDTSQSGAVMVCPTCLQKITPPQPPAEADQKFILSGKKVDDRPKTSVLLTAQPVLEVPKRNFPVAVLALLVLIVLCSATAAVVFHGRLFKSAGKPTAQARLEPPRTNAVPPPRPPVVIPHAADTNWMLNLAAAQFPETPAAGRIHGRDFLCERSSFQAGILTLRQGTRGGVDFGLVINFGEATPEMLAGTAINVTTNAHLAARVNLRWKETDQVLNDFFQAGYALRLEFGTAANNRLPGKIYFCAPDDDQSYVAGTFNADIRKPRPAKPAPPNPTPANN